MKVFYHCFQAEGDVSGLWRQQWHSAMILLMDSGLSEFGCDMSLVGSDHQRRFVTEPTTEERPWMWRYPFLQCTEFTLEENENRWENLTLSRLWKWAKRHHEDPLAERVPILYFHTKGALTMNYAVLLWKRYMESFLVEDWQECVRLIREEGADTVGVDFRLFGGPHYSGNFWWAASDYIARLTDPDTDCSTGQGYYRDNSRIRSEYFICHAPGRHVSRFDSGYDDLYRNAIHRREYVHVLRNPLP